MAEAGNTELSDGSYARKTGIEGTVLTDDANDRQDISIPDQTFVGLDGSVLVKALIGFSVGAGDANVILITGHDISVDPDGSNLTNGFDDGGGNDAVSWDGSSESIDFSRMPGKSSISDQVKCSGAGGSNGEELDFGKLMLHEGTRMQPYQPPA